MLKRLIDWDYPELIKAEDIIYSINQFLSMYREEYFKYLQKQDERIHKRQEIYNNKLVEFNDLKRNRLDELNREKSIQGQNALSNKQKVYNDVNKLKSDAKKKRDQQHKDVDEEISIVRLKVEGEIKKVNDMMQKINSTKSFLELNGNCGLYYKISSIGEIVEFDFVAKTRLLELDMSAVNNMVNKFNSETSIFKKKEAQKHGMELYSFIQWASEQKNRDINEIYENCDRICYEIEQKKNIYNDEYSKVFYQCEELLLEAERKYKEELKQVDESYAYKLSEFENYFTQEENRINSDYVTGKEIDKQNCKQEITDLKNKLISEFESMFPQETLLEYINYHSVTNRVNTFDYKCCNDVSLCYEFGQYFVNSAEYFFDNDVRHFLTENYPFLFDENYLRLPFAVDFYDGKNMCFEYDSIHDDEVIQHVQNMVTSILLGSPAMSVNFGFIDPLKSTNTFAPFNKFIEKNKPSAKIITDGIATSPDTIREKLKVINDHMEHVISTCLQSNQMNIFDYNKMAGPNAEPYQFVVVMDFPAGFNVDTAKQLEKIIESGPRCGVYTILMTSLTQLEIADANLNNIYQNIKLKMKNYNFNNYFYSLNQGCNSQGELINIDIVASMFPMISDQEIDNIVPIYKKGIEEAGRIIIKYDNVMIPRDNWFEASTKDDISIPLGLIGVDNAQFFQLGGDGVSHHALIAGESGSGKTTLLHSLVTNAMLKYSADELEIYMVDFKRGVEFKVYGEYNLPNIKLVAIESNRKFGYDVLEFLDREQKRRSDIFKQYTGCKNISQYRELTGEKMPRILLIIDEYHELFNAQKADFISSHSAELLQRVLSQGRAFGIHIILATQSISNVGGLNQSVYDLIAVRVALKCTPSEARLILGESADEVKLLKDSGMAIYNFNFGDKQASSLFRVAYLENDEHTLLLEQISDEYTRKGIKANTTVVDSNTNKNKDGTQNLDYFSRCKKNMPIRAVQKRKPIIVPFATDEDNNLVYCDFVAENFAAYLMGAAGSGKSTLLHTIIAGLLMNYHPDELELWLMDFKMTEFNLYVDNCPPHIKYILLEKSEELVFDIIDKLTDEMKRRQMIFKNNSWGKHDDVPVDVHMPAIFIIIDEFAQMSQVIQESMNTGAANYAIKLENLLTQGRAFGFKFIFASQTYTTGVRGLTDTATKNIQMRFAMKNTREEIRETLRISSTEMTPEIEGWISSLPVYKSIFKCKQEDDTEKISMLNNLYATREEIEELISDLKKHFIPCDSVQTENNRYLEKNSLFLDGSIPKCFDKQVDVYTEYETGLDEEEYDDCKFIYPGTPCSFERVKPIVVYDEIAENILIAGGSRDEHTSAVLSTIKSYVRSGTQVNIWTYKRDPVYKKISRILPEEVKIFTDLDDICKDIQSIDSSIKSKTMSNKVILCMGYNNLNGEFEIVGNGVGFNVGTMSKQTEVSQNRESKEDLSVLMKKLMEAKTNNNYEDIKLYSEKIKQYNAGISDSSNQQYEVEETTDVEQVAYDARKDIMQLLKWGPNVGIHFVFSYENPLDISSTRMNVTDFKHKLLLSMSRDLSIQLAGNARACNLDEGTFIYTGRGSLFTLRNHAHKGLVCNGWTVDEKDEVVSNEY